MPMSVTGCDGLWRVKCLCLSQMEAL